MQMQAPHSNTQNGFTRSSFMRSKTFLIIFLMIFSPSYALSQQTLERKTGSASTPQSLGPQCRAPVILPSIGGDNNDMVWVLQRLKADDMV